MNITNEELKKASDTITKVCSCLFYKQHKDGVNYMEELNDLINAGVLLDVLNVEELKVNENNDRIN